MVSDMAEFLWNKFLNAFEEAKSELELGILSRVTAIKQVVEEKKICSSADLSVLSLLHSLNDAISDCRIFAQQMHSLTKNPLRFNRASEFFFMMKMKRRLNKIKNKLMKLNIATPKRSEGGETSDTCIKYWNEYRIFGFDEYKVEYEQKLLEGDDGLKAIGIHGMGGSGKTTLAHMIYESVKISSEFDRRIWVSLSDTVDSNEPEIGAKVVKRVLEELRYYTDGMMSDTNLDELLAVLIGEMGRRRCLIVLDDIWINHEFWDSFVKVLQVNKGGALIVTSRIEDVARGIVGEENLFHIPPLHKDDCWKIFLYAIYEFHLPLQVFEGYVHHVIKNFFAEIEEEIKKFHGKLLESETRFEIKTLFAEKAKELVREQLYGQVFKSGFHGVNEPFLFEKVEAMEEQFPGLVFKSRIR